MLDVTPSNAIIQKVNSPNSEKPNVSCRGCPRVIKTYQKNYNGWVIVKLEGKDKLRGNQNLLISH